MMSLDEIKALKSNLHATFDSPQGKESMKFMEKIGSWYPQITDPQDTNAIIARDANRRLLGTIKTILELPPDQLHQLHMMVEGGE